MNLMLVSVTERTREIGIRMAVGARRQDILLEVLVEAGTLTGVGGIVGLAIGGTVAALIAALTRFPAQVHPGMVAGGVLFSIAIGLFFGLYPANRAARLDPVAALRQE
jgi:putative ABC transport system permease protein